jgi:hypothetical protein
VNVLQPLSMCGTDALLRLSEALLLMLPAAPKPASTPYYLHDSDSDDESSSDESLDHGGEIGPPAPPAVIPVVPAPAPASASPPPRSPSPVAPPRPPSPVGIGARLPRRTRTKPREGWKPNAQLDDEVLSCC